MPRPPKCRRIQRFPDYWIFSPNDSDFAVTDTVFLTLDEYEVIRLIDYLGLNQEDAAKQLLVARTTVTAIYDSARKKIADGIINGKRIMFQGGMYRVETGLENLKMHEKGNDVMRIAVTYDNGEIFQHFGHTEQFKIYDVENGLVTNENVVNTNGQGHGALVGVLAQGAVDVLICGGIGGGAQMALNEAGIELYAGNIGSADDAVKKLLDGSLQKVGNATCDHHHGNDHKCGDAGNHECGGNHSCHA
ncbi:Predicted DNA-binding protein, UPF0251 family [Oribacterium sp. KHPX15]|uniref:DUF134 domain-containing protein n=1 Tax=Oribacterium sp. KHPX15 TaxID=1855342 RepID=UPI00089BFE30|nr:DUF134 domain-containing protein [Oribacterium sp. KHPX15]SEA76550.1 Predicted DNA-binding protein, UPF0251 family [Oribacterium sp. KHPX15]